MDVLQIIDVTETLLGNGMSLAEVEVMVEEMFPRENKCDRIFL